jgi:hypothetical protein
MNLGLVDFRRCAKSEMDSQVRARTKTSSTKDVSALPHPACCNKYLRSNRVARTSRTSNQLQGDPVIVVLDHISEERGMRVHAVEDNVGMAVVEEVAKRHSPGGNHSREPAPGSGWDFGKFCSVCVLKQ